MLHIMRKIKITLQKKMIQEHASDMSSLFFLSLPRAFRLIVNIYFIFIGIMLFDYEKKNHTKKLFCINIKIFLYFLT